MTRDRTTEELKASSLAGWTRVFGEARTRILLWYAFMLLFFIAVALPTIQQRLNSRINERVRSELIEELGEFQELLSDGITAEDKPAVERLERRGQELPDGPPTDQEELASYFDVYLARRVPEDDTFLIAIVDGRFYKSSPRGLPRPLQRNQPLMERWQQLTKPSRGEPVVEDPTIGSVLYIAEPITVEGETLGVLAIAHTTAGERSEALEALQVVVEVSIIVLTLALIVAWFAAGRILAPLRLFLSTAQSISESELTQRIPVHGAGEIAELAITFNEMMDRLEAAFTTQQNFINDAGHELRTPITIVRGHLELMGDDPQEQQETLEIVMDELDRMSRLVEDLILLAKAERPDFLYLETVEVKLLTEELFAKMKVLADRNWQLETIAIGQVVVDRQRIAQAIMNLAQNAAQHTTSSDTISFGSAITTRSVRLWVRDTGEGIEPADQKRIFERFARASNSRRRSEGSGLGLSIVQAIAQAHNGKVYLVSQRGTGSTFTIVLPIELR